MEILTTPRQQRGTVPGGAQASGRGFWGQRRFQSCSWKTLKVSGEKEQSTAEAEGRAELGEGLDHVEG